MGSRGRKKKGILLLLPWILALMDLVVANERLQRVKALDRHGREYQESHNIQVNAIHPNMQQFSNLCMYVCAD